MPKNIDPITENYLPNPALFLLYDFFNRAMKVIEKYMELNQNLFFLLENKERID